MPQSMINSVIIPIIKNKSGDFSDKNNYRPIALSSIISKIFEHIIIIRLEEYLWTTNNQFGFKSVHLKDLHEKARQCYLEWKTSGRSRSDHTDAEMLVSRLQFKYTLRHFRANETMMRADPLQNALKNKKFTSFWKDVQKK